MVQLTIRKKTAVRTEEEPLPTRRGGISNMHLAIFMVFLLLLLQSRVSLPQEVQMMFMNAVESHQTYATIRIMTPLEAVMEIAGSLKRTGEEGHEYCKKTFPIRPLNYFMWRIVSFLHHRSPTWKQTYYRRLSI